MKTFASLFTGGGLADIGALQAGYELAWGVELDPAIAEVAQHNLKHPVFAESVIGFDWRKVDRVDHLHMSPPCQDFSVAKKSGIVRNANDELATACIEAIQALHPKSITLENVEGYRKAPGFQRIVNELWGMGYWVQVDVLNSADFGVPQTRRRLILQAVHGSFPSPLPGAMPWQGWYQAIEDLIPDLPETKFADWQIKRLPEHIKQSCFIELMQCARPATIRDVSEPATTVSACLMRRPISAPKAFLVPGGNSSSLSIREGDEPCRTVESTNRVGNIPRALLLHSMNQGRVVRMTPRALARFQSVPDWYELPSDDKERFRSKGNQLACRIIGNGVPCKLMEGLLGGAA